MENEIATIENLVEEINNRPILGKYAKTNYETMKIKCPECGKDTDASEGDGKSKAYCEHCGKHFSNINFLAKHLHTSKVNGKYSTADLKAMTAVLCRPLGIKNPFAPATSAPKPTQATNTNITTETEFEKPVAPAVNPVVDAQKSPKNAPNAAEGTFTPKDDLKTLLGENMTGFFNNSYKSYVEENKKYETRKTGFSNIDSAIYSFQPGIYIVGGLPALGKTTFALQWLYQMALQGETCIYCSYEMQSGFLYSKLLAREIFLMETRADEGEEVRPIDLKYTLTASKITFGKFDGHAIHQMAMEKINRDNLPIYIWELAEVNINKLLNRISQICKHLEKPPIVVIDYLQLLSGDESNKGKTDTKTALDSALRKFFNFRRETNTTFIIISSLNRTNYNNEISFESLKETGSIEYSADCIFGLQLMVNDRTATEIEKAKKETPRRVQLKCLKSRFSSNFDCGFYYYPQADTFLPMTQEDYFNELNNSTAPADEGNESNNI